MADNYLQFSESLDDLTPKEVRWLKDQLAEDETTGCPTFLKDYQERTDDDDTDCGFQYEFREGSDARRYLWICAEEHGDAERVAHLVRKFLQQFHPDQCWSLTYATTCSKPRVGEFGGGAVFVTADAIRWQNAYEFVEQQHVAFQRNGKPHQGDAEHGETTATEP